MSNINDFLDGKNTSNTSSGSDIENFLGKEEPKTALGDIGRSLKSGVQQLPGMVTGLADIPFALAFNSRPVTKVANALGEATGFQPGKWAKETQYSEGYQKSQGEVSKAFEGINAVEKDPNASIGDYARKVLSDLPEVASALARNPLYTVNKVAESIPSSLAGGLIGKGAMVAGRAAGAVGTGLLERKLGQEAAAAVAGGIGEGAAQAGQALNESDVNAADQRKNAIAAIGSGAVDAGIAMGAGKLAQKAGFETLNTALAKAGDGTAGTGLALGKRLAGGALTEGLMQELPQSAQEQVWKNWAEGKPLMDGLTQSAIEGALSGAAMGAGGNIMGGRLRESNATTIPSAPAASESDSPAQPLQLGFSPDPMVSFRDGTVARQSEVDAYINALPEDQRSAFTAKIMGLAPQPFNPETDTRKPAIEGNEPAPAPSTTPSPAVEAGNAWRALLEDPNNQIAKGDSTDIQGFNSANRVGEQWQQLQKTLPDATPSYESIAAQRLIQEQEGAARARERDKRIQEIGQQVKNLNLTNPSDELHAQKIGMRGDASFTLPSQKMGINPGDGIISRAATAAVDANHATPATPNTGDIANTVSSNGGIEPVATNLVANENRITSEKPVPTASETPAAAAIEPIQQAPEQQPVAPTEEPPAASTPAQDQSTNLDAALLEATSESTTPAAENKPIEFNNALQAGKYRAENGMAQTHDVVKVSQNRFALQEKKAPTQENPAVSAFVATNSVANSEQNPVLSPAPESIAQAAESDSPNGYPTFSNALKAGKFMAQNKLKETHEVVKAAPNQFVIQEKQKTPETTVNTAPVATNSVAQEKPKSLRWRAYEKNPFLTFLAAHGLKHDKSGRSLKNEFSPDKQVMVSGYGPIFKKTGRELDELLQPAIEMGYLPLGSTESDLYPLVQKAIAGKRVEPMYAHGAEDAIVRRYEERLAMEEENSMPSSEDGWKTKAEYLGITESELDELLAPLTDDDLIEIDDSNIPWDNPSSVLSTEQAMRELGFTEDEIQEAIDNEQPKPESQGEIYRSIDETTAREAQTTASPSDGKTGAGIAFQQEGSENLIENRDGNPDIPFSRNNNRKYSERAKEQANASVQETVDEIVSKWENAPKIIVAFDLNDPKIPQQVRDADLKQRSGGASGAPEGFFYKGDVYLMSSKLKTKDDAARVLMHEALGHYGLRGVFGDSLNTVLSQVATMRGAEIRAKSKQYGLKSIELDRLTAAEEVLAEMAQNYPQMGFVRTAVAAIRTWLRKNIPSIFGKIKLTNEEIIRNFIIPARGWVERSQNANSINSEPVFSRSSEQEPMFSRQSIAGDTGRYTQQQMEAMRNVGFITETPTIQERARELWKDAGKKLAQGIVDQFAPIKSLSEEAYRLMRMSKGTSGAFETLLQGGKLKITEGVYDFDETAKGGVVEKLLMPLQGEHHDFLRWTAANRANELSLTDREHLFTKEDIAALKSLADGETNFDYTIQMGAAKGSVTRNRQRIYEDANRVMQDFNRNVLDIAEQSGLIDGEARKIWQEEFYVPFYRVMEEEGGSTRGMSVKGGVIRQQAFKKLKGGKQKLSGDLLDNVLMNWASLLDASAKNRAAKASIEAAEKMGIAQMGDQETLKRMGSDINNRNGIVWFMDGGEKRYSMIDNTGDGPMIMTAITALEYAGMKNPVMNAMSTMKHYLTMGVTVSPFFKIRNLIRDSISVLGLAKISGNPAANLAQGWKLTDPKSDSYFRLLAGGATIHFASMYEGSEAKRIQKLVESGVGKETILDSDNKIKSFYNKYMAPAVEAYNALGERGEAVNRAALYDQLRKQGVGHAEASLQARDLMDFSMNGSFASIRFLTQVVPFMNARLQGLYKLGKSARENPQRFGVVLGAVTMFSLALLAANGDDEDWKKREDWDRNNFWWFKFGGMAFRIPKPFEIGAVATLAERGFELAFDKEMDNKRFLKQVMTLLGDNLSFNPTPQVVKPLLDVYANKNGMTEQPIESMGMEKLKSDYRFTSSSSMVARATSTALNTVAGTVHKEAWSPVQIDYMLQGYFGWLGAFVVGATDLIFRPVTEQTEKPSIDMWKKATGGMVSDLRDAPSRYVSKMYEQAKEMDQAYGTWQALMKEGKTDDARQFLESNRQEITKRQAMQQIKRAEAKYNEQVRIIERSTTMSAEEKRERIRQINVQKNRMAQIA